MNLKQKVYARNKDIIGTADFAKMGSLFSVNRGVKYLLCLRDVFTKYARVKLLKDRKVKTILHSFIRTVN